MATKAFAGDTIDELGTDGLEPAARPRHQAQRGEPIQTSRDAAGEEMQAGDRTRGEGGIGAAGRGQPRGEIGLDLRPSQRPETHRQRPVGLGELVLAIGPAVHEQDRD